MAERPVYEIRVSDQGDHVYWVLLGDDVEVARGKVLLMDSLDRDSAFLFAFENANDTRLARDVPTEDRDPR